jgi:hypothetical protein
MDKTMNNYSNEIWMPISGYEGRYEVSNHGNVRGWINTSGNRRKTPVILKSRLSGGSSKKGSYPGVTLMKGGKKDSRFIHTLVAEHFICPRPEAMVVRHLDGNPNNNHAENLAWGTQRDNAQDKKRHGTVVQKLTDAERLIIHELRRMGTQGRALANMFGVSEGYARRLGIEKPAGALNPIAKEALALGRDPTKVKNKPVQIEPEKRLNGPWKNPQVA